MKKLYFGLLALAALSLSSCQKDQDFKAPEKNMVTVTLVADKAGDETKAAAVEDDSKVTYEWTNADKSNLKLFAVTIGSDNKEALTEVENPTISVSSDNKTLTITATVEENTTLRAVVAGELTNETNKPKIKVNQSPAVNNFDPNTDVLVADDVTVSEVNELALTFRRQAVVAKMTLKNMVAGEKVNKVTISSEKDLTGYYDYADAKMKGQNKEITVKYDDVAVGASKEFPVYFVAMPNEGQTLTVTVKTDQYTYTKTFGNGAINLNLGGFARFGVNLSGCGEPVVSTDYTGDWVITGMNGENAYAMMAYVSGNNTPALGVKLDTDKEEIATTKLNEIKMHFEKVAEGDYAGMYTIADMNGNYFYAASSSANQMKADNPATKTADYYWDVTLESDGTYSIIAEKSTNRNIMRFNPGNSIFSCYSSGQNALTLYPYSWVVEDTGFQPSGDGSLESPYNVAAAVAYTESLGTATSTDYIYIQGIISQIANNGTYGSNGYATFYISDDGLASGVQFEAYRIKYLLNKNWVSGQTNIKVGDEVILCGKVKMYNSQAEISQDGYLYSLNGVTAQEDPELVSIAITTAPTTTTFTVGDTFVFNGKVTATYDDGSTKDVTASVTTDGATVITSAGENKTVTVSYTEKEITKTATYTVTVNEAQGGDDSDIVITLDCSTNIFGLSTTSGNDAATEITKTVGNYSYKLFASNSCYYYGSKALFIGKKTSYITFPAISNYKLCSVKASNCTGASSSASISIVPINDINAVSGGEASTIAAGGNHTWVLTSSEANTEYRIYIGNAYNVQFTEIVLTYKLAN